MSQALVEAAETAEPETLDWLRCGNVGDVFYDVGASNGVFALYAAAVRDMRVVAFEAEAQNYALLETNLYLNRAETGVRPRAFCIAAGQTLGASEMYCMRNAPGFHTKILGRPVRVGETAEFMPDHVQSVLTLPLDEAIRLFGLPVPSMLKIDVDGAEAEVIAGAHNLLSRPELRSILIELVDTGGSRAAITAEIESLGFILEAAYPVRHLRGGYYDGLFNCVFRRNHG